MLPPPRTDIDALPYVDQQYTDAMRKQVEGLIEAELKTFKPAKDYLAQWPVHEPNFEAHPLLEAEWMRICDQQPMSKLDTTRYQLDPPPSNRQTDIAAWQKSVDNAQAQLEHQANRISNLELLQKHGANVWRAQLNSLEAASKSLTRAHDGISSEIDGINRKRKLDQTKVGPTLQSLEGDWVSSVRKNIVIESECMRLEQECFLLKEALK